MRTDHLLQTSAVTLALLLGSGAAGAQQQPQSDTKPPAAQGSDNQRQQSQAEKALQTQSGKAGKEEPSSHVQTDGQDSSTAVFINGALAVPGAPTDTETVPAKFSEKNAAADRLITVAYTFKSLSDDERRRISDALKGKQTGSASKADIGAELPLAVELQPVPDDVARQVPQTKGYLYSVTDGRVILVSPANRIVVGAFESDQGKPDGTGQRPQ